MLRAPIIAGKDSGKGTTTLGHLALLLYAVMEAVGYAQLRKVGRAVEDAVNRTAPIIDENARVLDDQDESVK